MEQVIHQANIEWKIPHYRQWSEVLPKGAVKSSGVYAFKFDGVAETFKFELKITPRPQNDKGEVIIKVVNRNDFNVGIEAKLTLEDLEDIFEDILQERSRLLYPYSLTGYVDAGDNITFPFSLKHHVRGTLIVKVEIQIFQSVCELKEPNPSRESASQSLKRLLGDKTFSDFVITCRDGTSFNCHRAILANKSTVFMYFFKGQWKDSKAYKISDFEPEVVKHMIYFMYTNELPEDVKPSEDLLKIGDKYDVNGLAALCAPAVARGLNAENAIRCRCL